MSLLFDISPTDEPQKKTSRKPRKTRVSQESVDNSAVDLRLGSAVFLGRLDGDVECVSKSCRGTAHDVTNNGKNGWRVECCFCGTGQWIEAPACDADESATESLCAGDGDGDGVFRFPDGRFAGMTIEDASKHPRWREYCAFAAAHHENRSVSDTCKTWLAESGGVR